MEERRKFVRLDTRLSTEYRIVSASAATRLVTKDIGGGGVCIFVSEPLSVGTQLQVTITLPDASRTIAFTGEVVWCESYEIIGKAQQHRSILAGVKFVSIAPEDQREIMRYVILSLQPRSAS